MTTPENPIKIEMAVPEAMRLLENALHNCLKAMDGVARYKTKKRYNFIVLELNQDVATALKASKQEVKYQVRNAILDFLINNSKSLPNSVVQAFENLINLTKETTSF
jgi:hypothetical protein